MKIFESDYKNSENKQTVLAFGNFDGVHIGHCYLLNEAKKYAAENGYLFGVYTFVDSPKFRLANHSILTDLQGRLSFIDYRVFPDFVYLEKFDDVKDMDPAEFVKYIVLKFNVAACFCGENFSFGKYASGSSQDLVSHMNQFGRHTHVVSSLSHEGSIVSSTLIKTLLQEGNVELASHLLGSPYGFTSKVIHGAHLGHTLGFPTVNQIIPKSLVVPKYGVYATSVIVDGTEYMGVTNFGVKPTVSSDETPVAETHIIDFEDNVYDKHVGIYFCKRLRDEKKFSSLTELKKNIAENIVQTKNYFEEYHE
ncbi:MAG: riboflavin biosynthesis protein RibF [Clostridia bacterium]|nr:riboflavin biosynthesis protein RibF [Clostridia bacterium]